MSITITWHGHSCFSVSADGYSIVLDPYAPDSVPGLPPLSLSASQVLCSHGHSDHGYTDAVDLSAGKQGSPFTVTVIQTFHDDQNGSLRGENRIHILEADGLRIAHLGDLGCTLEPGQMELLKDLDAIMIPVGGYYTIDAAQARALVEAVKPRIVIPCTTAPRPSAMMSSAVWRIIRSCAGMWSHTPLLPWSLKKTHRPRPPF